jgi:hypothetical protein
VRNRWRVYLAAAGAACCLLIVPEVASAVSYGIADASSSCSSWGASSCNTWGYGFASYSSATGLPAGKQSAFTRLRTNLPLQYVRLSVPYDSVYEVDPSTGGCRWAYDYTSHTSSQYPNGGGPGSAWYRLVEEVKDAHTIGLTPLVVLTQATSAGQLHNGDPATPDLTAAAASGPNATTTVAGEAYDCGVSGLTYLSHVDGLAVGEWEAWNEPDASPAYNGALNNACGSLPNNCGGIYDQGTGLCGSSTYTQCGPLEAADMYAALSSALGQLQTKYGWPVPPIAAGTFAWPSVGYFNAYIKQLTSVIGQWPAYWSYHDYADVTSGSYTQSYGFTKDLHNTYANAGKAQASAWISEAGIVLTDGDRSYNGQSITCANTEADDAGTLGACVDASPSAQQSGANAFLNLASSGSYAPGQVTQVYWFQFQPANASTGWDSGLLAPPRASAGTWAQVSPDGVYGSNAAATGQRSSYCVLARLSGPSCSAAAVEGSDWSIQPRTVTGGLVKGQTAVGRISGDQSGLANGSFVTGSGVPPDTVMTSGAGSSSWVLSKPAATTGTMSLTASG